MVDNNQLMSPHLRKYHRLFVDSNSCHPIDEQEKKSHLENEQYIELDNSTPLFLPLNHWDRTI